MIVFLYNDCHHQALQPASPLHNKSPLCMFPTAFGVEILRDTCAKTDTKAFSPTVSDFSSTFWQRARWICCSFSWGLVVSPSVTAYAVQPPSSEGGGFITSRFLLQTRRNSGSCPPAGGLLRRRTPDSGSAHCAL